MGFTFTEVIDQKLNVITRLEFLVAYDDIAVHHGSHYNERDFAFPNIYLVHSISFQTCSYRNLKLS